MRRSERPRQSRSRCDDGQGQPLLCKPQKKRPFSHKQLKVDVLVRLPGGHSFLRFQPFRKLKVKTLLAEYPFSFSPDTPAVEFEVPTELAKVANPRTKPLWVESGTTSFNDTRSDNHERLFEAEQRGILMCFHTSLLTEAPPPTSERSRCASLNKSPVEYGPGHVAA